ncbi:MAG: DMT family transporter [Chitinophagales bacterium]
MLSKGIKHMLIAGVFFSFMNLGVKYLKHIPSIEIVFFRALVTLIISFIMIKRANMSLMGKNKPILFLRGLFGVIALSMYFYTLQAMPFGSAVTIQQLSPIFATIIAVFILKEKVLKPQWLFFLISFAGVALIKGFDTRVSLPLLLLSLGAAFFSALAYNMVRKLKDTDHPLVVVFYFPLIALPVAGIFSAMNWVMPQGWDWLILLGIGIATQIAQVQMTKALQMESIANVSIVRYLTVIYALGFGFFLFKEKYNWLTIVGILLVVAGVVFNILYKKHLKTQAKRLE